MVEKCPLKLKEIRANTKVEGQKIVNFCGRPLWMAPNADSYSTMLNHLNTL
jgi:hypothetical protein